MNTMGQPTQPDVHDDVSGNGREPGRSPADERVELRIPAASKYLRLARLTVAGFAGDLGFDMQSIEDLRIAVDELCAAAIDGVDASCQLGLTYSLSDGRVRVDGQLSGSHLPEPELHRVARELLGIVADGYDLQAVDGGRSFWVVKEAEVPQ